MSTVEVSVADGVALVELARPERRNAIAPELADDLRGAAEAIAADESVRAVVLAGRGPSFCAGADMKERLRGPEHSEAVWRAVRVSSHAIASIPLPVVAAIHGHAIGAGLELAAQADYRVADPSAVMGIPEVKQGITSGGGLMALASLVPRGTLARLAYAGEIVAAEQARELGLVDEVAAEGGALARANELAAQFAAHPRAALLAAKTVLRAMTQPLGPQQWELAGLVQRTMEGGAAQREALQGGVPDS